MAGIFSILSARKCQIICINSTEKVPFNDVYIIILIIIMSFSVRPKQSTAGDAC